MIISPLTKRHNKRCHISKIISEEDVEQLKNWFRSLPRREIAILATLMLVGLGYLVYLHFRDTAVLEFYRNNPPVELNR